MENLKENEFIAESRFFPAFNGQMLLRWINKEHSGKEFIEYNEKITKEHQKAAFDVYQAKTIRIKVEMDKFTKWNIQSLWYDGNEYELKRKE